MVCESSLERELCLLPRRRRIRSLTRVYPQLMMQTASDVTCPMAEQPVCEVPPEPAGHPLKAPSELFAIPGGRVGWPDTFSSTACAYVVSEGIPTVGAVYPVSLRRRPIALPS